MKLYFIILLMLVSLACQDQKTQNSALQENADKIQENSEISPYVNFLQENGQNPIDYILNLFSKYDIVVLAERDHRETTQWEFIYKLTSDSRFIDKVGNVFTEVGGSIRLQKNLDKFMENPTCDPAIFLTNLRDYPFFPDGWQRTNIYQYWIKMYQLNSGLADSKKVRLHLTDIEWDWQKVQDKKDFDRIMKELSSFSKEKLHINRDNIMALHIINQLKSSKDKALVIMNTRHAYKGENYTIRGNNIFFPSVASRLSSKYPGRVITVMFNYIGAKREEGKRIEIAAQNGKWDAAFQVLGNKPIAFNFSDSPFGRDPFDYVGELGGVPGLTYDLMFDGLIFWESLSNQYSEEGIPGFWTKDYQHEVVERYKRIGDLEMANKTEEMTDSDIHKANQIVNSQLYNNEIIGMIEQWTN